MQLGEDPVELSLGLDEAEDGWARQVVMIATCGAGR
jgi:hypothetical protein